ncbi:Peroxidase [Novymonas esmeraldas]|uniref:Peroxidase n=1 Tax=Novymonas esmeraldas TaxID=1808958 RepID=A0AAW0F8B5_9TRYP
MIRVNVVVRRARGIFSPTPRTSLWWGYKESDLHRLARQRPWWETAAIFTGLLVFVNVTSVAYYGLNRWYQRWRPSGNEIHVREAIDQKLFSRPDLAVVAVRMLLHHALSNAQTPFGCPIVAPENYRQEAEEIVDFVWELNREQPMFTFPDLWAMFTAKAMARLGGPNVTPLRGREDPPAFMTRDMLLAFPPALIKENERNVLGAKRVLSRQGFSLEQLVALIGCVRCVGFHDAANFHTRDEVKPKMRRRPGSIGPRDDEFHLPATTQKTTMDPYVFGSEYFDLLLDYKWHQRGFLKQWQDGVYRCSATDRAREVTLLDPFSEKSFESQRRKAEEVRENAGAARKGSSSSSCGDRGGPDGGRLERSGEAQLIPGAGSVTWGSGSDSQRREPDLTGDPDYEIERVAVSADPCAHVSMRGMDVMLLDDGLTKGWLHQFVDNELEFYAAVSEVMLDLQQRGHNPNALAAWK